MFPRTNAPITLQTRSIDVPNVKPNISVAPFNTPSRGILMTIKMKKGTTQVINNVPEDMIKLTSLEESELKNKLTQNSLKGKIATVAITQKIALIIKVAK